MREISLICEFLNVKLNKEARTDIRIKHGECSNIPILFNSTIRGKDLPRTTSGPGIKNTSEVRFSVNNI